MRACFEIDRIMPEALTEFERKITELIKKSNYSVALSMLSREDSVDTIHSRYLFLLECYALYETGNYDSLLKKTGTYYTFITKDDIDYFIIDLMAKAFEKHEYFFMSRRLNKILEMFQDGFCSMNIDDSAIQNFRQFVQEPHNAESVRSVIKCCYEHNLFTEMGFFVAYAKKSSFHLDDEIMRILNQYPQLDSFSNDIVHDDAPIYIDKKIHENCKELFEAFYLCLGRLGKSVGFYSEEEIVRIANNTDDCCYVLGYRSNLQRIIQKSRDFSKRCEMYYAHYEDLGIDYIDCVLIGDYFKSMRMKWEYDFSNWGNSVPTVDFSVVIPVKNDGTYLSHAIQSCLNQDYRGSYEIIISDNSDNGNDSVSKCLESFTDPHIKYVKPRKTLSLGKSFEFAYLSASGKYLLSIGSDDALLPYALSSLYDYFQKNKNIDVISWENARYEWASTINNNRPNLTIKYRRESAFIIESEDVLANYYQRTVDFGYLPKLYLGTCFRRLLIKKIMECSGKFEDGISQDIYLAVLTARIVGQYLRLGFPIAVSGVSPSSTGYNDRKKTTSIEDINKANVRYYDNYRYSNRYSVMQNLVKHFIFWAGFDFFELVESSRAEYWFGNTIQMDDVKRFFDVSFNAAQHIKHCDVDLLDEQYRENYIALFPDKKYQPLLRRNMHDNNQKLRSYLISFALYRFPKAYSFLHQLRLRKRDITPYYHTHFYYDSGNNYRLRDINSACKIIDKVVRIGREL